MAVRLFVKARILNPYTKAKLKKKPLSSSPCQHALDQLSQTELSRYLHKTIMSNLPYYLALSRYRDKRERASTGRVKREGRMWRKNLRLYFRLTESGLKLLKTGYAKKPKSPV